MKKWSAISNVTVMNLTKTKFPIIVYRIRGFPKNGYLVHAFLNEVVLLDQLVFASFSTSSSTSEHKTLSPVLEQARFFLYFLRYLGFVLESFFKMMQ